MSVDNFLKAMQMNPSSLLLIKNVYIPKTGNQQSNTNPVTGNSIENKVKNV